MKVVLLYTAGWLGLVILAIFNGIVRVKVYAPFMDDLTAHQVSTISGIGLFGIYIWLLTGIVRIQSSHQALLVGSLWLVMTVAFEFLFGHYVVGYPWSRLFQDYNILKGRVWLSVLIWITLAPYIFYRVRSK